MNCCFLLADQADFIKVHFALSQPHLDKPCQGGGELSDTGPTGKSLSFPAPCLQVPVCLTVPRVTSDGRRMALRSCWVNNISHHGHEVQPDHCYSKTVNEARCWWILRSSARLCIILLQGPPSAPSSCHGSWPCAYL